MKRLASLLIGIGLVVTSLVASSAKAAVLFESAVYSNIANPATNAWCSSCGGTPFKVFDQFSLGSAGDIGEVNFAIQSSYGSNWNILVEIWAADRSTNLYSHVFNSGSYVFSSAGNDVSEVTVDLSAFGLAAGTYWMSWYDSNGLGIPGYLDRTGHLYQENNGAIDGQSAAFRINGANAVPEPASLALMGLGLAGLAVSRRRKSS